MRALLVAAALAFASAAFGQASEVDRPDAKVEQRLKDLAEELRCLVCQNQTIADSNAPLAVDLRNQIREQVRAGRSDDQIRAYMVERYGEFVLYRPPVRPATIVLWFGPLALAAAGIGVFIAHVRRRRAAPRESTITLERRSQIEAMLDGQSPNRMKK